MRGKHLKKYPFCGEDPEYGSLGEDKQNWVVWCPDCGIPCCETGLQGETLKQLRDRWNTRIHPQTKI